MEFVKKYPMYIEKVENPSEELQLIAIRKDALAVQYIKNPTRKVMEEAVIQKPLSIAYIKNPDEELQLLAIRSNSSVIQYIKKQTKQVKLEALRKNPLAINHIKGSDRSMRVEAFFALYKEEQEDKMEVKDPLLQTIKKGNKEMFVSLLPKYKESLQSDLCFEGMVKCLLEKRERWLKEYIDVMMPLTDAQKECWKPHRLKTLY